jgi:hypothetical protein
MKYFFLVCGLLRSLYSYNMSRSSMRDNCRACKHFYVPESPTHARREEAVDDWVRSRVERRQALDKRRDGDVVLRVWHVAVYLEQTENEVGTPAQNKHCNSSASPSIWDHSFSVRTTESHPLLAQSVRKFEFTGSPTRWRPNVHW